MIIDKLSNERIYNGLGERMQKAFAFLSSTDLLKLEPGKYPIDGDTVYAVISEYDAKPIEKGRWEAHQRYIDIQYIIKGAEKMGYTNISNMKATVEYNDVKDVVLGEGNGDFLTVEEGTFAVFFPKDAHMPGICNGEVQHVKKAVIKVLAE